MNSVFKKEWKAAADEEWESQMVNASSRSLNFHRSQGSTRQVGLTYKFDENIPIQMESRLVLRGDKQRPGIDYGDSSQASFDLVRSSY